MSGYPGSSSEPYSPSSISSLSSPKTQESLLAFIQDLQKRSNNPADQSNFSKLKEVVKNQTKYEKLSQTNEELVQELKEYVRWKTEMEPWAEEAEAALDELRASNDELQEQLNQTRAELETANKAFEQQRAELETANKAFEQQRAELETLKETVTQVIDEIKAQPVTDTSNSEILQNMKRFIEVFKQDDLIKQLTAERDQMKKLLSDTSDEGLDKLAMTRVLKAEEKFLKWASEKQEHLQTATQAIGTSDEQRKAYIQSQIMGYAKIKEMQKEIDEKEKRIKELEAERGIDPKELANAMEKQHSMTNDLVVEINRLKADLKTARLKNLRLSIAIRNWFNGIKRDREALEDIVVKSFDKLLEMRKQVDVGDRMVEEHPLMVFFKKFAGLKETLT